MGTEFQFCKKKLSETGCTSVQMYLMIQNSTLNDTELYTLKWLKDQIWGYVHFTKISKI